MFRAIKKGKSEAFLGGSLLLLLGSYNTIQRNSKQLCLTVLCNSRISCNSLLQLSFFQDGPLIVSLDSAACSPPQRRFSALSLLLPSLFNASHQAWTRGHKWPIKNAIRPTTYCRCLASTVLLKIELVPNI